MNQMSSSGKFAALPSTNMVNERYRALVDVLEVLKQQGVPITPDLIRSLPSRIGNQNLLGLALVAAGVIGSSAEPRNALTEGNY